MSTLILVTGGGGFLGGGIVHRLLAQGYAVRSFSRGAYPELTAAGVEVMQGDVANPNDVLAAARGCDAVIHTAALAGVAGPYRDYYQTNVVGTRNVLRACESEGIARLVYTSTPSVTFAGQDQNGVNESEPYPTKFLSAYSATKAEAEQLVRRAGTAGVCQTVSLRPHLVWGAGDNHLLPRLVERSHSGQLRLVGSGENRVDSTCIDNAVEAHLLALESLARSPGISGRAYFISNGEPLPMAELINRLLEAAGAPPVSRQVPVPLAYGVGWVLEKLDRSGLLKSEPRMTRFLARQLSTAHWFDLTAARTDLGYTPRVTIAAGLQRLRESC